MNGVSPPIALWASIDKAPNKSPSQVKILPSDCKTDIAPQGDIPKFPANSGQHLTARAPN